MRSLLLILLMIPFISPAAANCHTSSDNTDN